MKWFDDTRPKTSSEPLSAHELLRAHAFVHAGEAAVAAAKTRAEKKAVGDVKRAAGFMRFWLTVQAENPMKRVFIREQMLCLPAIPTFEVAA